ncbi:MAG: phage tail protein, partial [Butyrivibrio sp.]|nr:phage tail protein [Butyrivibrio sp.]
MIPILYEKNATTFNTNGLGRLSDAISCHVIEERNGKYELTMEYPIDGVHFSDIEISAIICAVPADGKAKQPFRIYKVEKLISGKARIYAEHISYRARYVPVMPFSAGSCVAALEGLATNAAITNPFTFWTDISKSGNYIQELPESIRARLGGQKGSILDLYGGELEWDIYDIRLHSQRGHDSGVTLRYGKNITDLTQEKNITNTYTAVCPYYKASDDVECLVLPEKYITSPNAGNFPYIMAKSVDMTNEFGEGETATVETLRSKTQAYITKNNIGIPAVSIKVSFVALWQTEEYKDISALERVNLCDTVTVVFEKLGVSAAAKVIKTNYNVLIDRYDSIELGEAKSQLSSKIADQETNMEVVITSHMQKAIAHATSLITGGLGGYVLLKPNADGQPEEILIMDKPDIQQARRMIRMNKNGIGFSDNGYNGPFRTAWVIDGSSAGHFVADYIDTGKLNADLIKTGVIMDEAGNNSWNMLTGEFRLSASTQVVSGSSASGIASQQNITALSTRITANANGISAESTRASAAEGNLSTRISQTADGLSAEITRASSAEGNLSTRITANANGISAESTRASAAEGNLSTRISQTADGLSAE